jgi:signal transduction histidine kinase
VTHLLRGSIECHSQPGWGTMFDILIPIATQEIP